MTEASQALVHYSRGSDSDVVYGFRYPSTFYGHQHEQGIASCSNVWKCLLVAQWSDMFYTSGAQGPKRSRVRDWRPSGQWKECPRKIMDPSTLHWDCQATGPGKRHPRSHVRGPPEWALVGPLDCRLVSRCHSRRLVTLLLMSRLQSACNNQALQPFSVWLTLIVLCISVT